MKRIRFLCLVMFLFLFTACSEQKKKEDTGLFIYYMDKDATKLVAEVYEMKAAQKDEMIEEVIAAMRKEPHDQSLQLAKPIDVNVMGYSFGEAGQLQLTFDDNYSLVTGTNEILMRAAIVKTFTQIPGVDEVEFYITGLPLSKGEVPVGRMQAEDFIDSVGEMTNYSKTEVITIYFANEEGTKLVSSQRQVQYDGSMLLEQAIIEQMIDGPTKEESGMQGTIPSGTVLNRISKKDGICSLDFNNALLNPINGISTEVTIYSIVNTLVEQPTIDKVQITMNGETVEGNKYISLNQLFERNLNLIEGDN